MTLTEKIVTFVIFALLGLTVMFTVLTVKSVGTQPTGDVRQACVQPTGDVRQACVQPLYDECVQTVAKDASDRRDCALAADTVCR